MDEVPTWSKKVQDWMDRMDIRSQRRIDVGFILTTYTRMCMSMYIYIYWLVVSTPLKLLVSWDDYSVPNHQPAMVGMFFTILSHSPRTCIAGN